MPVEDISPKLLSDLWRRGLGVDPSPLSRASPRIGLWRSPAGLWFFHPAEAGSGDFYRALYRRLDGYQVLARYAAERADFKAAAALLRPGDRVLDVGGGDGAFAARVPAAAVTILDAHAGGASVLRETPAEHAQRKGPAYDAVCGFQLLEHVADPLALARAMQACLKPGGLLLLAVPLAPSPLTAIPNHLVNLPPHHLSWWSEEAGRRLVDALGMLPVRISALPPSRFYAEPIWLAKLLPRRMRPGRHVRPGLGGLLLLWLAWRVARVLAAWRGLPRDAAPCEVFIAARNPD